MLEKSSSDTTIKTLKHEKSVPHHIVFLHRKFRRRSADRYIVDLAMALKNAGHKVTIFTSELDQQDCLEETNPLFGELTVNFSGWWLPSRFWFLKAVVMALRLIFLPPSPKPDVVVLDTDTIACYLLACFTKSKIVYLNHFYELKNSEIFAEKMKITKDLLTAKTIKYADEIIVLNKCFGEIFRRSFPNVKLELSYISPCVDTLLWREGKLDINRIVPDLPKKSLLFVVFGQYTKHSNFELAIKSFENLLLLLENELKDRLHLVIGGNCKNTSEQILYYNELKNSSKNKYYASQITFLKQTPPIHKKTLIEECLGVLITAFHELFPETVLEAMKLGRPVISTNAGFPKEVLTHRISGILIEAEPHTFASAMYKIVANPTIQMFISDMAKDVYRRQYSYEVISRSINDIVKDLAGRRASKLKL